MNNDLKEQLSKLTKFELINRAKQYNLKKYSKLDKEGLINLLLENIPFEILLESVSIEKKNKTTNSGGRGIGKKLFAIFTIIGALSSIIALLLILLPKSQDGPTETDKNLFALGIGLGTQYQKMTFRFPGETISLDERFTFAISGLLKIIGYPLKDKEKLMLGLSDISERAKISNFTPSTKPWDDKTIEQKKSILSELKELQKPLEDFIFKRYKRKGIGIFKLGLNIPPIQRTLWKITLVEEQLDGKLPPELKIDKIIFMPYIGVFRILAFEDFFSDNLRKSMNFIATANVSSRSDREKMMEELIEIGFAFEMALPKKPIIGVLLKQLMPRVLQSFK